MTWLVPLLVLASLAVAAPVHADATLDGVRVHTSERTSQVVTVKHIRGWHARVTYWTREPGGPWEARRQVTDGRTGCADAGPGHPHPPPGRRTSSVQARRDDSD